MPKNEIGEYDETDSGNTDISGIGLSDATLIDQLDNIARAQMGALKRWFKTSLFRLRDSTDQTKLLAFDLSGQTTATTRTQKTPNYNGTLASQALGTAIASASSIDLGAASGSTAHITGTTTITALGTADAGIEKTAIFDGILTLTHNATSLILPTGANITTTAGDAAVFVSEGSGNWKCTGYARASGQALAGTTYGAAVTASGTEVGFTGIEANVKALTIVFSGVSLSGTAFFRIQIGDSGGYETSGYAGANGGLFSGSPFADPNSSGFDLFSPGANRVFSGSINLYLANAATNTWACSGQIATSAGAAFISITGGDKALSGALDRIRITTSNGTDTFDAGTFNLNKGA